ncbi:MAG TPA: TIM barrel protein [Desulforhopalus sp.]|nr:TIM barrel protein [Desulforhopalus sp.]
MRNTTATSSSVSHTRAKRNMARFSANLGFLWTELDLPAAVARAAAAGFGAVECHWPYATPAVELRSALRHAGIPLLCLNTRPGDLGAGDFGLTALPGREIEARVAIEEALAYAAATDCRFVHVMAGRSGAEGRAIFLANLDHAADRAAELGLNLLIEPINHRDIPGYHLSLIEQAAELVLELGRPNLRLMFDCYHVQIMQGDLLRRLERHLPLIGHVQIAAVPLRQEPDTGEIAYDRVINALDAMGYRGWIGAEYRPAQSTDAGLGWLRNSLRRPD